MSGTITLFRAFIHLSPCLVRLCYIWTPVLKWRNMYPFHAKVKSAGKKVECLGPLSFCLDTNQPVTQPNSSEPSEQSRLLSQTAIDFTSSLLLHWNRAAPVETTGSLLSRLNCPITAVVASFWAVTLPEIWSQQNALGSGYVYSLLCC